MLKINENNASMIISDYVKQHTSTARAYTYSVEHYKITNQDRAERITEREDCQAILILDINFNTRLTNIQCSPAHKQDGSICMTLWLL